MKIINKIIIIVIAVVGLYATFIIASDINTISDKISSFKIEFLPIIVSLVTCGWFVLFTRWHLLLVNSKIFIPKNDITTRPIRVYNCSRIIIGTVLLLGTPNFVFNS